MLELFTSASVDGVSFFSTDAAAGASLFYSFLASTFFPALSSFAAAGFSSLSSLDLSVFSTPFLSFATFFYLVEPLAFSSFGALSSFSSYGALSSFSSYGALSSFSSYGALSSFSSFGALSSFSSFGALSSFLSFFSFFFSGDLVYFFDDLEFYSPSTAASYASGSGQATDCFGPGWVEPDFRFSS